MRWDYMIVGQGLAGSVLSYTLMEKGKKVLVIDNPGLPKASAVAAGIFNPFTGRRPVKTWMLDHLFPFLLRFYRGMEQKLQVRLLHPMPIYRPFLTIEEQNQWSSMLSDPQFADYLDRLIRSSEAPDMVRGELGGIMFSNCGYLNIPALLAAHQDLLREQDQLLEEQFQYDQLEIKQQEIHYQGERALRIIFCEGPNLTQNPYFNWLPLRPVKGEIIEAALQTELSYMVNRGIFMLPLSNGRYKVGATFEHEELNWLPSKNGRQQLKDKLSGLVRENFTIHDQLAGIRPATKDRRPFVGIHPKFEPLGVFNGLGTKGVSLAPYFAEKLFELMEWGRPLPGEVSINRYF